MDVLALERLIERGQDSYEARLALGQAYLRQAHSSKAIEHLEKATELSPEKTTAWQALGEAYLQEDQSTKAAEVWRWGIEVATCNGDEQAKKVMQVWLKRLG